MKKANIITDGSVRYAYAPPSKWRNDQKRPTCAIAVGADPNRTNMIYIRRADPNTGDLSMIRSVPTRDIRTTWDDWQSSLDEVEKARKSAARAANRTDEGVMMSLKRAAEECGVDLEEMGIFPSHWSDLTSVHHETLERLMRVAFKAGRSSI